MGALYIDTGMLSRGKVCAKSIEKKKHSGKGGKSYASRAERNRGWSWFMKSLTWYNKEFGYILVNKCC